MTPRFLRTVESANEWPCTSIRPVWELRIDQVIDMHGEFCLVFTASPKWRFNSGQKSAIIVTL